MALVEAGAASGGAAGGASIASYGQAATIGAGLLGGLLDFPIQKSFNVKQTRHQREWLERMSNTQYQRAVKDLEAAGLNPMLAYTQGGAGGYGNYQTASVPSLGLDVHKAVGTAKAARAMDAELQILKNNVFKSAADANFAEEQANMAKVDREFKAEKVMAEIAAIKSGAEAGTASAKQALSNKNVLDQRTKVEEANAASASVLKEMRGTPIGNFLIMLREVLSSVK